MLHYGIVLPNIVIPGVVVSLKMIGDAKFCEYHLCVLTSKLFTNTNEKG
jgi:hypothetical protein